MTTPSGVPNLPVGALTPATLAQQLQNQSAAAHREKAASRIPGIFDASTGGSALSDLSPFGIITKIWAEVNSRIATADPADIQGPADIPELLTDFIESLPLVGELVGLLDAIIGEYNGDDAVLQAIQRIFEPLRRLVQLVSGNDVGFPTQEELAAGWADLNTALLADIYEQTGIDFSSWAAFIASLNDGQGIDLPGVAIGLSTAESNLQTVVDNIYRSVFGGTSTNNTFASVMTSLQKGWAEFWDGLTGNTGSTAKLPSDVRVAGAGVRSTANTGVTNAATAQAGVQSTVDGIWQSIFGGSQTGNPLASVVTNLQTAWSNFWDGLNGTTGSTGKLPSDVQTAASAVRSTANTGVTNAATAQGTANTANTTAGTATTNLQTTIDGIWQSIVGGTGTNNAASTVKTNLGSAWAKFWDGLNGTSGTASKLPSDVQTAGAAVRSTANTGVTNAATADAKAVTADGKAAVAQQLFQTAQLGGSNLLSNFGFEDTNFANSSQFSTEQAYQGTRSWKWTVSGNNYISPFHASATASSGRFPAAPNDSYYYEMWVYPHSNNSTVTTGQTFRPYIAFFNAAGTQVTTSGNWHDTRAMIKGQWNKISGTLTADGTSTIAAGSLILVLRIEELNNTFYIDNAAMYRITEGYVADGKAVAAQSTANTGVTNAATAQGTANTATTNLQTVVDGTVQAVDGGSATGAAASTFKTKLQLAWANFWDGLNGTTGTTIKLPSDVRVAGAAVRSTANTGVTNAATADAKAVTADGKAVAINQALFNQATPGSTIAQSKVANLTTDLSAVVDKVERIGSGCKISRVSTGFLTATFGRNKFPANWFWDTKNSATADYTVEQSGSPLRPTGKITVAYAGWYLVEIGFKVNQASWGTWQIAPLLYVNGSVNKVGSDASATGVTAGARFSHSAFIVYLSANQYIEPGYDAYCKDFLNNNVDIPNVFTGAAGSVDTYCSMTLLNRSYA